MAGAIDSGGDPVANDADYRLDISFNLRPVSELDIIRHITGLRGGSAPGLDGVSADVLKENAKYFSKPLLHLLNLSITAGVFPNDFKIAKVFPLYKSNDFNDKNNFRPISLLSVFSKVLERIVKEQLVEYLLNNDILEGDQFGFRQDRNISDALFEVCKDINSSIFDNNKTMLIFLDLKKSL